MVNLSEGQKSWVKTWILVGFNYLSNYKYTKNGQFKIENDA